MWCHDLCYWRSGKYIIKNITCKQDESFSEAISNLIECMRFLHKQNPKMIYNIFLHKTDAEAFAVEEKKLGSNNFFMGLMFRLRPKSQERR